MIATPREVEAGQALEFDICIVGAGAAGITLARELKDSGVSVGLFEAGGRELELPDQDHPFQGENVGKPYPLAGGRLRVFGGSTHHWGGWCRPLDDIDFVSRPYIPLSGWPFGKDELRSYYTRAAAICEIDRPWFDQNEIPESEEFDFYFHRHDPDFVAKPFRFSKPTRFGHRYGDELERAPSIRCFLETTVVQLEASAGRVERLRLRAGAKEFYARGETYILATGAIENARLLLLSSGAEGKGLGNDSDFVGRCFADHLGTGVGLILTSERAPYHLHFNAGIDILPHLSFQDEYLEAHQWINFGASFLPARREFLAANHLEDPQLFPDWPRQSGTLFAHLLVRFEPTPNPESRITLTGAIDPNGMRRVRLDWRWNDFDFRCLDEIGERVALKVGAANLGRVKRTFFFGKTTRQPTSQSHQMGTTRMSNDPARGVVDPDCRMHGLENLYLAGGSVFPTFGFANPTLTIVALAVRLADHLKVRLRSRV